MSWLPMRWNSPRLKILARALQCSVSSDQNQKHTHDEWNGKKVHRLCFELHPLLKSRRRVPAHDSNAGQHAVDGVANNRNRTQAHTQACGPISPKARWFLLGFSRCRTTHQRNTWDLCAGDSTPACLKYIGRANYN